MRLGLYIFLCVAMGILWSCNKEDVFAQKSRSLDSLSGSVHSMLKEFGKADTALVTRSVNRYHYYSQFIEQNVNDTLSKEEADRLQQFIKAGKNLENFQNNRTRVLSRALVVIRQIQDLSEDITARKLEGAQVIAYYRRESMEAKAINEVGYSQQNLFISAIEEYKNSIKAVEQIIRSRNHGDLPVIIKDTINL